MTHHKHTHTFDFMDVFMQCLINQRLYTVYQQGHAGWDIEGRDLIDLTIEPPI